MPGDELLVHQQRLQLASCLLGEHPAEQVPRHRGLERIEPEVRELFDLLLELVVLRHEHLAERARVDEAQQPALGEVDHDVRVLRRLLARGLRAQQLTRHAEVHDRARRVRRAGSRGTSRAAAPRRSCGPRAASMNSFLFLCRRTERVPVTSTDLIFLPTTSRSRSRRKTSTSGSSGIVAPLPRPPRPADASTRPTPRPARPASSNRPRPRRTGDRSRRPPRRSASRDPGPRRGRRSAGDRATGPRSASCSRVL